MKVRGVLGRARLTFVAGAMLLTLANCADMQSGSVSRAEVDMERLTFAVDVAQTMRSKGQRVWCVPFARNASGIEIYGNAKTWWNQAKGQYQRQKTPHTGAVMAFTATRSNPLGHVAVVSEVEGPRRIRVNHANWRRNRVSLDMAVVDVSKNNDWSAVRLESNPGALGRVYPVTGFILPPANKG